MEGRRENGRERVIDYLKSKNLVTEIQVFFNGKRMTSIPRQMGEEILCYFTSHKFIIACKSHLLFFFAPILILDVLKWFCASDHREEFNNKSNNK